MRHVRCAAVFTASIVLLACGGDPEDRSLSISPIPSASKQPPPIEVATPYRRPEAADPAVSDSIQSPAQPDLVRLSHEVGLLRRDVAELRAQLHRLSTGPATGARAGSAPTEPPQVVQRMPGIDGTFKSEHIDIAWSSNSTASVRAAFNQATDPLVRRVRNVECRSKSCRVEIDPAAAESLQSELPAILALLAPTMPNVAASLVEAEDGQQAAVYLSR